MPRPRKQETVCLGCRGSYFTTTTFYSAKKPPTGRMFALKEQHKANRWPEFHQSAVGGDLICPFCDECMLGSDGKMQLRDIKEGGANDD